METERRGILYPARLPAGFHRIPAQPEVADLVSWWWVSVWDLNPGETSRQHVLAFPASNLVVEEHGVELHGPTTAASYRDLLGHGWAVAALLRPAGLATLVDRPAALRDTSMMVDAPDLHRCVVAAMEGNDVATAVEQFARWLSRQAGVASPDALLANRLAEAASTDPEVRSVADLCATVAASERSVHRLTERYVGLTPHALIRRRRLQEAAEDMRCRPDTPLGDIAAAHSFSDHAHLTREFRHVIGRTPSEYRADLQPYAGSRRVIPHPDGVTRRRG